MIKKLNNYLRNKKGMSLVEVLTAMTILTLMIFCFAPLMLSYLQTINIAGEKMERVYRDAGNLEVLLGKNSLDGNYTVSVDTVPIKLTSPDTTVTVDGNSKNVATATIESFVKAYGLTSGGTFSKDNMGNPSDNGKVNISTGQATFYTDKAGSASGITLFPSSLTDDFKVAYITIYSADINFVLSQCEFVTTGSTSEIQLTKGVDYDLEYHPDRKKTTDTNILLLTVYGGGDKISFETSPLVFKHMGQRYEIQIDAPSMIMVGEKAPDNNYYYYVSRGELEEGNDGENYLLVHRREMNSTDQQTGKTITLTSAMNDVEWVSSETGDKDYGYYVMCGDNGQIRRFWKGDKRKITVKKYDGTTEQIERDGNYYWGGDYTYHTDINNDEVDSNNRYYISQKKYDTTANYYYVYRGDHGNGFVMGGYKDLKLMNANTFTINALDTNKTSITGKAAASNIAIYVPDGEAYTWAVLGNTTKYPDLENGIGDRWSMNSLYYADGDFDHGTISGTTVEGLNRYWNLNLATDWFPMTSNAEYYAVNGVADNTNMITLTSVDCIQLSGSGASYYTLATDNSSNYYAGNSGIDYPSSTYNLYCGYIPAVMDIWSNGSNRNDNSIIRKDDVDKVNYGAIGDSSLRNGTVSIKDSSFKYWPKWKGVYGIIPYTVNSSSSIDYGKKMLALDYEVKYTDAGDWFKTKYQSYDIIYFPFTNIKYAAIGKACDSQTTIDSSVVGPFASIIPSDSSRLVIPQPYVHDGDGYNQQNVTGGEAVDITMSYLSHPLAISAAMNPTDDMIYDMANNKDDNRVFYWNNSREAATYLDCASTMVPAGENDIPVSLLVGYISGGLAEYTGGGTGDNAFVNSMFNNGIVLLRAGDGNGAGKSSDNFSSGEEKALDNKGYELTKESNYFHQFYYLNSRTNESEQPYRNHITIGDSIGDLHGAYFWQNNRHISYVSVDGGQNAMSTGTFNSSNYNYLRCHPLTNTKVNCAVWGTSWCGNPVAMWGTDNGTLLSWKCEIIDDNNDGETVTKCNGGTGMLGGIGHDHKAENHPEYHNDRSVVAEFQSYHWVDNVNKTANFPLVSDQWLDSLGSAKPNSKSTQQYAFTSSNFDMYEGFYDACSRTAAETLGLAEVTKTVGFISTLENINDVSYSDDIWVACGDQSDANPADYCGTGSYEIGNEDSGTKFFTRPYISAGNYGNGSTNASYGKGGSWINVNYWIDVAGTGKQSKDNRLYQWSAVQISTEKDCNIVQVNCVNGMWIATGYKDANGNDEYDDGEQARIFWTYDPRVPCGVDGGWSSHVRMYDGETLVDEDDGTASKKLETMGGINSCATRD